MPHPLAVARRVKPRGASWARRQLAEPVPARVLGQGLRPAVEGQSALAAPVTLGLPQAGASLVPQSVARTTALAVVPKLHLPK
jgi:hypothetical protein